MIDTVLRPARKGEAEILTKMSIAAFHTDYLVGGDPEDGPPDYDSVEWHEEMLEKGHLFTYERVDGEILGGAVLFFEEEVVHIDQIFIDPAFHGKGYGAGLMESIEKLCDTIKVLRLDCPLVNVRTNALYQKLGYKETGREEDVISYEKRIE